ncbi:hypothetical protein D3C81_1795650 [compost metagenome]
MRWPCSALGDQKSARSRGIVLFEVGTAAIPAVVVGEGFGLRHMYPAVGAAHHRLDLGRSRRANLLRAGEAAPQPPGQGEQGKQDQ